MNEEWKNLYDKWLQEGDLKMLMYLQKIQRYLSHGREKTRPERINLMAQLEALLEVEYQGTYRYFDNSESKEHGNTHALIHLMKPNGPIIVPDTDDLDAITEFLRNDCNLRIKPQPVDQLDLDLQTHPMWLLWNTMTSKASAPILRTAQWLYRSVFIEYMERRDHERAARVYQRAQHRIKIRMEPLPLLCPHVLRHVMKAF
jgi:hypothetical protein